MKKSEREHLKEDPFKNFIASALETIKESKQIFITGFIILAVLITAILVFLHFKQEAQKKDNAKFLEAVKIMDSKKGIDEKINALTELKGGSGLSGISKLNIASLYYQKKEYKKAEEVLTAFSSSISHLNEKKAVLLSEVYRATSKKKEALAQLKKLANKDVLQVPKDSVLLSMAKLQKDLDQKRDAIKTLKKLIKDYPNSFHVMKYPYRMSIDGAGEAKDLLDELVKSEGLPKAKKEINTEKK